MEETLSWQAKLAKSNINITSVIFNDAHTLCTVCYEFPYHPKPGQVKWFKTANDFIGDLSSEEDIKKVVENKELPIIFMSNVADGLLKRVLSLRKELEG